MFLLTVIVIVCFAIVFYMWKRRHFYYASFKINGPPSLPLLGNGLEFIGKNEDILQCLERLKNSYGFPMRAWLGPRFVVMLADPKDYQIILNHPAALSKDAIFRLTTVFSGKGLITCLDVSRWRLHRKLITPTFCPKILHDFMPLFEKHSLILCEKLESVLEKGTINVYPFLGRCHLDIICETAMGVKVNAQIEESEYLHWANKASEISMERHFYLWSNFDFILKLTKAGRKLKTLVDFVRNYNENIIQTKLKEYKQTKNSKSLGLVQNGSSSDRKPFLDYLIELSEGTDHFTQDEFRDEVSTFILAGSDTSAGTESFTLMMLGMHQEIQDKVFDELQEIFEGNERAITLDDLARMKYLERVIKETLRLFPPGYIFARAAAEDIKLHTCTIPKGTACFLTSFLTHRDPKLWKAPLKFDPDRFLPQEVTKRHPYSWIAFSSGPRNCIGLKFAMMSMKVVISTIVRKYRISCNYKTVEEIKLKPELLLRAKEGYNIALQLRTNT